MRPSASEAGLFVAAGGAFFVWLGLRHDTFLLKLAGTTLLVAALALQLASGGRTTPPSPSPAVQAFTVAKAAPSPSPAPLPSPSPLEHPAGPSPSPTPAASPTGQALV